MRPFNFLSRIRIGAKLGFCIGVGGFLVAGMIINEKISSDSIKDLTDAADVQQAIVSESIKTEVILRWAQIASRDLRMARTSAEVGKVLDELRQISGDGYKMLSALEAQTLGPIDRERFEKIKESFQKYMTALGEIGEKQNNILSLFSSLDQIELKWTRSVNRAVNSAPFANLANYSEVEGFINEAVSAFKDARTAAWRFFVLHEESQIRSIAAAADQATQKLNFARRTISDKAIIAQIDALLAIVPEYTDILKALAGGNKAIDVPYVNRRDEVGDTARAASIFKDNLLRVERLEIEQKGA